MNIHAPNSLYLANIGFPITKATVINTIYNPTVYSPLIIHASNSELIGNFIETSSRKYIHTIANITRVIVANSYRPMLFTILVNVLPISKNNIIKNPANPYGNCSLKYFISISSTILLRHHLGFLSLYSA